MREIEPHKIWRRLGGIAHEMVVIGPHYGDKEVANRVAQPHRPERHQWTVGGRRSRTSTVMRPANTPSENAFSRSGVLLLAYGMVARFSVTSGHRGYFRRSHRHAFPARNGPCRRSGSQPPEYRA